MKSEEWDDIHDRYYFHWLFNHPDRTFVIAYKDLWNENKNRIFNSIEEWLNEFSESELKKTIDASIMLNNERWAKIMYRLPLTDDFIENARKYFGWRKEWLDEAINNIPTSILDIPDILNRSEKDDSWYDIGGIRIRDPKKGIFIKNHKKYVLK